MKNSSIRLKDLIKFDKFTCENQYGIRKPYLYNETQLYIVFGYACNANCPFCVYHDKDRQTNIVDIDKLRKFLKNLFNENIIFCDVHLTGGEPTINLENFEAVLDVIHDIYGKSLNVSVNTNGINLVNLIPFVKSGKLTNVALSRHALTDEENVEIFGTDSIAHENDIRYFTKKCADTLHLSCNLIKGYVDSYSRVIQYLDKASELGVNDVGLVQLMDKNKFCSKSYVEYRELGLDIPRNGIELKRTRTQVKKDDANKKILCACENFIYIPKSCKAVSVYHRHAIESNSIASYLVYSGQEGTVRQGFSGNMLRKY